MNEKEIYTKILEWLNNKKDTVDFENATFLKPDPASKII